MSDDWRLSASLVPDHPNAVLEQNGPPLTPVTPNRKWFASETLACVWWETPLLCAVHYMCTTKLLNSTILQHECGKMCFLWLGQEDAWIWAVHLQLTVMEEVLTYIFHTPPSSPSVKQREVQTVPQTSPRNLPWAWWPSTFDELHNSLTICVWYAIATVLRNLLRFYMHSPPGHVPSDLTGDECSLF